MPTSTRFAVAIHVLSGIALHDGEAVRSEDLARSVNTNSTVVRRILGLLADAGITRSLMGQGGGSILSRPPEQITLLDIYRAVEDQGVFSLHRSEPNPNCSLGRHIVPVLETEFRRFSQSMEGELAGTSLRDVIRKVETRAGKPFSTQRWRAVTATGLDRSAG
ncbi:Rrf2 family transcriptional regulator [Novosphingobium taihuense]|uniref:Rrf2 family protein n=1 Tax=Novosphingobium taihuense TaxID=260085 RepID=A0A7W7ACD2_9SPHN|nr:Rrf2 family transcriptional regulator [Novosphingobium taihuense]MBB4614321.1 Rrf2 family protein [Novosphingobium taihuense]TWH87167.1 BadM/Rrf2 family transcriptional regulator [Novosphingobium taihuense]